MKKARTMNLKVAFPDNLLSVLISKIVTFEVVEFKNRAV